MSMTKAMIKGVIEWVDNNHELKDYLIKEGKMTRKNDLRRLKYNRLREAGYSAKISSKYKDYAMHHIDSLCEIKKEVDGILWIRVNQALKKLL